MMQNSTQAENKLIKAFVGPDYLCKRNLPYAADVFYHGKIIYFLPTGFHPLETESVASFPEYCISNSIALPMAFWKMCNIYFESAMESKECADILQPLRKDHIVIAESVYNRDLKAIRSMKALISKHPQLYELFKKIPVDMKFASRELMSHALYAVVLERGTSGAAQYLRKQSVSIDTLSKLIAAVILNRIRNITLFPGNLLIFEHEWYPIVLELSKYTNKGTPNHVIHNDEDSGRIEFVKFRLFEQLLNPVYGRCDTLSKSERIAKTISTKADEIKVLKQECQKIATEIVLTPTKDIWLKQQKLSELVEKEIVNPLSEVMERPSREIKNMLADFVLDSTVIAGVLGVAEGASAETLGIAIGAGVISSTLKNLTLGTWRREVPSQFIVTGMKMLKIKWEVVQKQLSEISIKEISVPD
jgi:hypothetical protein